MLTTSWCLPPNWVCVIHKKNPAWKAWENRKITETSHKNWVLSILRPSLFLTPLHPDFLYLKIVSITMCLVSFNALKNCAIYGLEFLFIHWHCHLEDTFFTGSWVMKWDICKHGKIKWTWKMASKGYLSPLMFTHKELSWELLLIWIYMPERKMIENYSTSLLKLCPFIAWGNIRKWQWGFWISEEVEFCEVCRPCSQ